MSPVPVREALRTLASQGLVVPVRNRGYRVSAVSEDDLDDTYRLRTIVDPLAVELATPRLTEDDFRTLEDAIEGLLRSYRADDWEQHEIHHRRFHFGIYGACGSRWLLRIIEMLWENSLRYQRLSTRGRGSYEQRAEEHAEILRACRARDAGKAAELMRAHLSLTARTVHDLVEPRGPSLDGNLD
jgi:DNA-binding GntR family transcriptional regulator